MTPCREKDQAWGKKRSTYYNEEEEESDLSSAAEEEVHSLDSLDSLDSFSVCLFLVVLRVVLRSLDHLLIDHHKDVVVPLKLIANMMVSSSDP